LSSPQLGSSPLGGSGRRAARRRFRLLTGGGRTALARQQTLRASIDWSYELLTETERCPAWATVDLVRGWTIEAAEAVCSGDGIESEAILEVLAHLVDKSLVTMIDVGSAARYSMLETIRGTLARSWSRRVKLRPSINDTSIFFHYASDVPLGHFP